jgi:hypothetical protein
MVAHTVLLRDHNQGIINGCYYLEFSLLNQLL